MQVGIYGIGTYLPEQVRRNDWWPAATVAGWRERLSKTRPPIPDQLSDNERATLSAMAELQSDPFQGTEERRVIDPAMTASEMETRAARAALANAGVDASAIDLLLVHSVVPDFLNTPNACAVHRNLGLPERCFTMSTEGMCASFLLQLQLAKSMIASGEARCALIIQSSEFSRIVAPDAPFAPWCGDGAAATVVGPVAEGYGLLSSAHQTDGSRHKALVVGLPDGNWYDGGRVMAYSADPRASFEMLLTIADRGRDSMRASLDAAGLQPTDVDFYAAHQGTKWIRRVTQTAMGLTKARSLDTFAQFGSISGANLPLILSIAERERLLQSGDVVALFGGGTGETWSSMSLRWGRG